MTTSLSDKPSYRAICKQAAEEPIYFTSFRRNPAYTEILEHVTAAQGAQYLALIQQMNPPRGWVDACQANDEHGGAIAAEYKGVGPMSPTTLRYMYVVCKLRRLFPNIDGFKIVEIGGGYGGQCRLIKHFYPACSYSIIDLKEARRLQDKYLSCYGMAVEPFELGMHSLAISNYAFSECTLTRQRDYLDHVLKKSARGYVTGNFEGMDTGFPRMKIGDLVDSIRESVRLAHEPEMGPGLWLWAWGFR